MTLVHLPSVDVPDHQKRGYSEADVHSKLFQPDMKVGELLDVSGAVAVLFTIRFNRQPDPKRKRAWWNVSSASSLR